MLHKRSIITNVKFIRVGNLSRLSGQLRYYQHRDERSNQQPQEKWHDRGLGDHWTRIQENCLKTATRDLPGSKNVAARTLVINPSMEAIRALPEDKRMEIMEELTERTIDAWFENMRLPTADYAYVIHQADPKPARQTTSNEMEKGKPEFIFRSGDNLAAGEHWHAHVVVAATTRLPGSTHRVHYRENLPKLHDAGRDVMENIWQRELGVDAVHELNRIWEEQERHWTAIDQQRLNEYRRLIERIDLAPTAERPLEPELDLQHEVTQSLTAQPVTELTSVREPIPDAPALLSPQDSVRDLPEDSSPTDMLPSAPSLHPPPQLDLDELDF